jgi:hypothetical protein
MKFIIKKEIFDKFVDLIVGTVLANGLDNKGESKEINDLL